VCDSTLHHEPPHHAVHLLSMASKRAVKLTEAEHTTLKNFVDYNKDGKLTNSEIQDLIIKMKIDSKSIPEDIQIILRKYDVNNDKSIDAVEFKNLVEDINEFDKKYRFMGYSGALARSFRYLAFTSDVGEALRPVASKLMVNASYGTSATYCVADVAWETYKVSKTGKNEHGHPSTVTQMIVERSTFQLLASLFIPAVVIHSSVDIAKHFTKRIGRFQKWGPSLFGLAIIPLFPVFLDAPTERAVEWAFSRYGPWAKTKHD
jgi:fission process protein 1